MASAAEEAADAEEAFITTQLIRNVQVSAPVLHHAGAFSLLSGHSLGNSTKYYKRKANHLEYPYHRYQDLTIAQYTAAFLYLLKG